MDFAQLDSILGIDTGTRGMLYFDAFESRRTTYIGPVAGKLSDDNLAVLPTWNEFLSWVKSAFTPNQAAVVAAPVPTPGYNQGMASATPVAPVAVVAAPSVGIGHVLAMPAPLPLGDWNPAMRFS